MEFWTLPRTLTSGWPQTRTPPFPFSFSCAPLVLSEIAGMLLAHKAHYTAGGTASFLQYQEKHRWVPLNGPPKVVGSILLVFYVISLWKWECVLSSLLTLRPCMVWGEHFLVVGIMWLVTVGFVWHPIITITCAPVFRRPSHSLSLQRPYFSLLLLDYFFRTSVQGLEIL